MQHATRPSDGRSYIVVFLFVTSRDEKKPAADGEQPPDFFRVSQKESSAVPVAYIELLDRPPGW